MPKDEHDDAVAPDDLDVDESNDPEGEVDPFADESAEGGVTEADLYPDDSGGDAQADQDTSKTAEGAEPTGKDQGRQATQTDPEPKPDDSEDHPTKGMAEPEGPEKTEDEPAEDEEPAKPMWDKPRQQADQKRASELREMNERLDKLADENAALRKERDSYRSDLPSEPEEDEAPIETEEDLVKAHKALTRQVKDLARANKALRDDMNTQAQEREARDQAEEAARRKAWYDSEIDRICETHGEQLRNPAIDATNDYFARQGYTPENPPFITEFTKQVEIEAMNLKGSAPAPKSKPRVSTNTGTDGQATSRESQGDNESVLAAMKREGKIAAGASFEN